MESIEKKLKEHMNDSENIPYPDFDGLWNSIQLKEMRSMSNESRRVKPMRGRKAAIVVGLSVALLATPVYAAISYDWTGVLSYKTGIQTALNKGLGQTIEQSVTKNGVTLTLHTAFTDENRTLLLYTLDPGKMRKGKDISYESITLRDSSGKPIKGHYTQQWDPQLGVYQGYFESEWVVSGNVSDVKFVIEDIRYMDDGVQPIAFDPNNSNTQEFTIQKDGIGTVTVQSFDQSDGKVLLKSAVTFTDPELKVSPWVRIQASNDKKELIKEVASPSYGTSRATGEYSSSQIFDVSQLTRKENRYALAYDREVARVDGEWGLNVSLSKKELESGTFKESLNIPLKQISEETEISEMIITPTQIRLILTHKGKYTRVPYLNYQLDVGGTLLDGAMWVQFDDHYKTEIRYEVSSIALASIANKPITLIAKHRMDEHMGNKTPMRLTDISSKPKSITMNYDKYPVTWTYYTKDNNLYVESQSSDSSFGGVNQTYYLQGTEKNYGNPIGIGINFLDSNKYMDVYENFIGDELEIYVSNYMTEKPDDELRVELTKGK